MILITFFLIPQKKLERRRRKTIGLIVVIVAIVSVVCTILAGLCLLAIDSIVHGTLYHYGLQFSTDWANPYWLIIRVCFSLLVIIALASITRCLFNRSVVKTWNELLRTSSTRVQR